VGATAPAGLADEEKNGRAICLEKQNVPYVPVRMSLIVLIGVGNDQPMSGAEMSFYLFLLCHLVSVIG
jgi:hypothetical protein